jgi:hypothetical protein
VIPHKPCYELGGSGGKKLGIYNTEPVNVCLEFKVKIPETVYAPEVKMDLFIK